MLYEVITRLCAGVPGVRPGATDGVGGQMAVGDLVACQDLLTEAVPTNQLQQELLDVVLHFIRLSGDRTFRADGSLHGPHQF